MVLGFQTIIGLIHGRQYDRCLMNDVKLIAVTARHFTFKLDVKVRYISFYTTAQIKNLE